MNISENISGKVFPGSPCLIISSLTTAASGVSGLILALITPKSPIIATIIGFSPADTATGIAITGIIARHGIDPGPIPLSIAPMMKNTTGIRCTRFPTRPSNFFASSSSVPLTFTIPNKYVIPTICMKIDELKPANNFPVGTPNHKPSTIAKAKQSTPTFAFLRKPITIASSNAISESIPKFITIPPL